MKITSFEYAGRARRNAPGNTTRRIICIFDMPQALAASISPFAVFSMAPRRNSVVYAAVLRLNVIRAHHLIGKIREEIDCIRNDRDREASCWARIPRHLAGIEGLKEVLVRLRGSDDFPCWQSPESPWSTLKVFCGLKEDWILEYMSKDILDVVLMPHLEEFSRMSD
jgi:hypothetical protein